MRRAIAAGLAVVVGLAGCNRGPGGTIVSLDGPIGSSGWHYDTEGKPRVAGIDHGSAYWTGRLFVLWTDASFGAGGRSVGGPGGFTADGEVTAAGGHKVPFRLTSPDGKTGRVEIAGTGYDLANGHLFLVATTGETVRVKQLTIDLSGLPLEGPDFRAFAQGQPEVRAFFQAGKP